MNRHEETMSTAGNVAVRRMRQVCAKRSARRTSANALVSLRVLGSAGRRVDDEPCALPQTALLRVRRARLV